MINKELEKMILDSGIRGVWTGYIRQEYGEELLNDLLENGNCVKVKTLNPLHKPKNRNGMLWAVVKDGFDKSIVRQRRVTAKTIPLTEKEKQDLIKRLPL